jgi:putative tryptophan/tyrosine transport system substrate-binding protein
MRRRNVILLVGGAAAALPLGARAQQQAKLKRIGFLRVGPPPAAWIGALRHGLREHRLIEGQNIEIEFGLAHSVAELPSVAAELVRRNVDVLFASGSPTVLPAKDAAGTIPVVFVGIFDFVETGQVASLARPGGNLTGMSGMVVDLAGRRMQLLTELLPGITRVAILVRTASPATPPFVSEAERSAQTMGVELQVLRMGNPGDLEMLLASASSAGGLIGSDDAVFTADRVRIAELALKQRLPTMFGFREMVEAGCLISYGADYADLYRRAASQVHKILIGAKPADLPVEQPTRFELVINLKTAEVLGLSVPPVVLLQADKIIE